MRWNLGLPDALKPRGKFRSLLFLLILIDTVLTPFLLPVIGYGFLRDQKKVFTYSWYKTKELSTRSYSSAFFFCQMRKVLDGTKEGNERGHLTDERSVEDKLGITWIYPLLLKF